jgi:dTDP-4-amino-4,6-dideoxygalactose transaminase
MSPERLEEKLISAEKIGKLPKIVIPVHFAGQSCDMQKIHLLSRKYGFKIIEDASHAIGGKYKNKPIGSCKYSDITVFSFHPVKIITTGEGGMAVTNSEDLANKMRSLRSHGIYNDPELFQERDDNEIWNYQQLVLGFNYRMTDIQASLGLSQMSKINKFLKKRQKQAYLYNAALQDTELVIPWQSPETISSFHLYPIRVKNINEDFNQKKIYDELKKRDIAVTLHYIPIHRQPYYEGLGFKKNQFPESEVFHREAISLPIFPGLSLKNQNYVIRSLKELLK